jgi:uncharacterized protein YidB (DUF937 family)
MGLLDSILGNVMGAGSTHQSRGGASSPLVKALMMLMAAKAYQSYRSRPQAGAAPYGGTGGSLDQGLGGLLGGAGGSGLPGGLGGALSGGLGGLLGGLVGGGGLGSIVDQFQRNGYGDHVDSWVGSGQNQRLAPEDLSQALGPDTVDELQQQTGMPRDQLLSELSQELPDAVDHFTPDGRLPTDEEASSRWV